MKTVYRVLYCLKIKRHDFENEFSYVEVFKNGVLKDCFFTEKEFLNKNGKIKNGGRKYFYCAVDSPIEKQVKSIDCKTFCDFENLYYYDNDGLIINITGK